MLQTYTVGARCLKVCANKAVRENSIGWVGQKLVNGANVVLPLASESALTLHSTPRAQLVGRSEGGHGTDLRIILIDLQQICAMLGHVAQIPCRPISCDAVADLCLGPRLWPLVNQRD